LETLRGAGALPFYRERRRHAPDGVEQQHHQGGKGAEAEAEEALLALEWEEVEQLRGAREEAEAQALDERAAVVPGDQEQEPPEPAPHDAGIQPVGAEPGGDGDPEGSGHPVTTREPQGDAVDQGAEAAGGEDNEHFAEHGSLSLFASRFTLQVARKEHVAPPRQTI